MRLLGWFLLILGVSVVQMYAAAPIGLAAGLDRGEIIIAMFLGGMAGTVAIIFFGPTLFHHVGGFIQRVLRRPPKPEPDEDAEPKKGRIARTTERAGPFGPVFLGIVGPLTIGGWGAAVLGVSMGMSKKSLIFWLALGTAIVCVAFVWTLKAATG